MTDYKEIEQKTYYLPVEVLKPHPDNPRSIKGKAFDILCDSIRDNPKLFKARPVICDKNLTIWAGNQRYRAAKKIGMKEIPVQILDLSEEEFKELMIRDNIQNGEWDENLLSAHFESTDLEKWGVDLSQFGVFDEVPDDAELTAGSRDKTPTIKVSFATVADLEDAKPHIEVISARYAKSTISVSAGEL